MKSRLVSDAPARQQIVILDAGEEAFAALTKFANDEKLRRRKRPELGLALVDLAAE